MKKKGQKGFSLIELMIVVVVIGFLAGVGIPEYQKVMMKARQSEVKSLLSGMYTSQKAFFAEWNQYYSDFNAVGYGLNGDLGYFVGFTGNNNGPATHPNAAYRGVAGTVNNATLYCATNGCTVSKARTTTVPASATVAAAAFAFGGAADLDNDATVDQWTIDQNKTYIQTVDDIAN